MPPKKTTTQVHAHRMVPFPPLRYEIELFQGKKQFLPRAATPQDPDAALKFAANVSADLIMTLKCSGRFYKEVIIEAVKGIKNARVAHFQAGVASVLVGKKNILIFVDQNVDVPDGEKLDALEEEEDEDSEEASVAHDDFQGEEDVTGSGFSQFF